MLPQVISPMPAHILFVKTVLLVVACGLLHGLFFVPVVLAVLPDRWTGGPELMRADGANGDSSLLNGKCDLGEELLLQCKLVPMSPRSDRYFPICELDPNINKKNVAPGEPTNANL